MLPIEAVFSDICSELSQSNQLLIQAPPGAGKSTWLPLQLLKQQIIAGKILLLEPRRVAARNIAEYLSQCLSEPLGQTIGLRMRGQSKVSEKTKLEVVTEGVLTRMLQSDPELSGYDLILFDEFHERSLQADMAFAFAYEVQQGLRDDLKIVLMSATLDLPLAEKILPEAKIVKSEGRNYPVECHYRANKNTPFLQHVVSVIKEASHNEGDILVFLPGIGDINRVMSLLNEQLPSHSVFPLHGSLSLGEQQKVLRPQSVPRPRVILSTNIAETSLTIEGIKVVVDAGLQKRVQYDAKTGFSCLFTERVSQASSEQRKGRAGRVSSGVCYRLWSQDEQSRLRAQYPAEIETADIAPIMAEVYNWGAQSMAELNWPSLPSQQQISQAHRKLINWQLISEHNSGQGSGYKLTELGRKVTGSGLPIDLALLNQCETYSASVLAAWLFEQMPSNSRNQVDLLEQLEQAQHNKAIKSTLKRWKVNQSDVFIERDDLIMALAEVFPLRLAKRRGEQYLLASGSAVTFHKEQHVSAKSDYIVVLDASFSAEQANGVIRSMMPVQLDEIEQHYAGIIEQSIETELSKKSGELSFYQISKIDQLIIDKQKLQQTPTTEQLVSAWLSIIERQGFCSFKQVEAIELFFAKLSLAHQLTPELFDELIDEESVKQQAEKWFALYLTNVKSINQLFNLDVISCISNNLTFEQQQWLQLQLPSEWQAPDGRRCKIDYSYRAGAKVALPIQSCYGLQQHPTIADGRIKLTLDLNSPAKRAMQTTQDIVGFWRGSYKDVQKDMKSRYPKHFWPDDPLKATPGTQTKR